MHIRESTIFPDQNYAISQNKYLSLERYHLKSGDVIMGRRGEMGRCAVVTETQAVFLCGTGSLFIRPNPKIATSRFIQKFLSSPKTVKALEEVAQGVTMANLNSKSILNIEIKIPSLKLQKKFDDLEQKIDEERRRY